MDLIDKKNWLTKHGNISPMGPMDEYGEYKLTWKANGGFVIVATGLSRDDIIDYLYDTVKGDLFSWCEVQEKISESS